MLHKYCSEYDVALPRQILGQVEQWLNVMGWHVSLLTCLQFHVLCMWQFTVRIFFHTFALRGLHTLRRFSFCTEEFAHIVKLLALHWKVLNILSFISAVQSWQICTLWLRTVHTLHWETCAFGIETFAHIASRFAHFLHLEVLHALHSEVWTFSFAIFSHFNIFLHWKVCASSLYEELCIGWFINSVIHYRLVYQFSDSLAIGHKSIQM